MTQELMVIDEQTALDALSSDEKLDLALAEIRKAATAEVFDVSTKQGQKDCKSMAAKVAKCKTTIDAFGKDAVSEMKAQCKVIDNMRKKARDSLDELKDEIRKPVTEIEEAAKKREADFMQIISTIKDQTTRFFNTSGEALDAISLVNNLCKTDFEEFAPEAELAAKQALEHLEATGARLKESEMQAEEIAKLNAEKAELEAQAREQKAAEQARMQAQAEAQRQLIQAQQEKEDAVRKAQQAEQAAEQRAKAEYEAKLKAEQQEALAREADVSHRQACNREALETMMASTSLNEGQCKQVIAAIAKGLVQNISINY